MILGIDPGHGGLNLGCQYSPLSEKVYTLAVANALETRLSAGCNVNACISSRRRDMSTSFVTRAERLRNADAILSLHVNAEPTLRAHGLRLFCPRDDGSLLLASEIVNASKGHWSAASVPVALVDRELAPSNAWLKQVGHVLYTIRPERDYPRPIVLCELFFASNDNDLENAMETGAVAGIATYLSQAVEAFAKLRKGEL